MEIPTFTSYITDPKAREEIERLMSEKDEISEMYEQKRQQRMAAMTEDERKAYDEMIKKASKDIAEGLERDADELYSKAIKEKLAEVSEGLSLAYIAKQYFGKSKEWLYQRLNGSVVNGKQAGFKREEVVQLQLAIRDFGNKLSTVTLI